jgi:hypothetical protein
MKLTNLILATTIALTTTIAPAVAKPTLTIANDTPLADLPNPNQANIPADRLKDRAPSPTRGILCNPSQSPEDCDDRVPMRVMTILGRRSVASKLAKIAIAPPP